MAGTNRHIRAAALALLLASSASLMTAPAFAQGQHGDHGSHGSGQAAGRTDMETAEHFHDEPLLWTVRVEQLEHRWKDGENSIDWEAQGFVGGDVEKFWLKAEGSKEIGGGVHEAEFQALYSRMVSDFWDFQAGLRHDIRPRPQTTYAVVGFQGLAPYFFEMDVQAFVSEEADVTAALEAEFDLLITQKLIFQPKADLHLALQDVPELGIGAGLSEFSLSARLRYEFVREFAPYIGVQWDRKLGETANFARAEGEDPDAVSLVAGIRFWF